MPTPSLPSIVIVSPALADANNGNWQTARRWQQLLRAGDSAQGARRFAVRIVRQWPDGPAATADACMLALHARRSAASIAAWAQARRAARDAPGLAVVLTGTDLYRDIHSDTDAQRSLALAQRLVVLQTCGPDALPLALRSKTEVIFQSTRERQHLARPGRRLRVVMVGHLREEKSPLTLMQAAHALPHSSGIVIDHIGAPLDAALAAQAQATARACPHYRWLGSQPHEATRKRIQRAHLLVHSSQMEGGAHVVMEAVRSGTPVLASRIAGNVGMLGADYAGYFEWNHSQQLVDLLLRCRQAQCGAPDPLYAQMQAQCALRSALFAPAAEQSALLRLVTRLLQTPPH